MAGGISGSMKESVQRAFSYVQSKKAELGIARDLETSDMHVEVIDLLGNRVEAEIGVAFLWQPIRRSGKRRRPALLVLGDMSVQGNIKPLRSSQSRFRSRKTMAQSVRSYRSRISATSSM